MAQADRRWMTIGGLFALTLGVSIGDAAAQDSGLRCLVPWSEQRDVPRLRTWLESELGEPVEVFEQPEAGLGAGAVRTATVLLGYELTVLKTLEGEGLLAPYPRSLEADPTDGSSESVAHRFHESWSPVQTEAGVGDNLESLRSWWDLGRPDLWGSVFLRLPDAESREGLILGQMAHDRDLSLAFEMEKVIFASLEDDTLWSPRIPVRRVLESLEAGQATMAPVREVVAARRDDWLISYVLPAEGFYSIPIGVAFPAHVAEFDRERFAALFEGDSYVRLCQLLDLEPLDADTPGMPEWMSFVLPRRVPIDEVAASQGRSEIARVYEYGTARNPEIRDTPFMDLFDFLMIGVSIVLLYAVVKATRPQRRVRGA